ncbi:unnamed protein product, partial [Mesorhabditis belari]|uniref:Peroxisomal membrane protein PEX13 n=1 Tax=Mesorhabditis belari TaxID=2138241 RepID=A0AAF3EWV2_9BILA
MEPGPSDSTRKPPPPLPPRPTGDLNHAPMGSNGMYGPSFGAPMSYGVGYSGYNGMYGGGMGGMYNSYGMGGYSGYGYGQQMDGNFSRLAEESSRGAFQSIESVVNAVTSVANMLSSTHNAVYSSFRAVIGVVDQFSRLKFQFSSLLASIAVFRFLQKLWRYLLVLLRLKPANYASAAEMAWSTAQTPIGADSLGGPSPPVNWPALFFWVVALGFPYMIYKCVSRMVQSAEEKRVWATGAANHYRAEALFDFQAQSEQELSFMAGERLRIAPKEQQPRVRGWLLGSTSDGSKIGLVPINYVKVVGKQSSSPPPVDAFEKSFRPPS